MPKLAKLQIAAVVRAERASKVESSKLRAQRSHFMYIVMGELLRRAHGDEGIKSMIITRAVAGIQKPKEKEKATKASRSASRGLVSPSAKAEGCCIEQAPGAAEAIGPAGVRNYTADLASDRFWGLLCAEISGCFPWPQTASAPALPLSVGTQLPPTKIGRAPASPCRCS